MFLYRYSSFIRALMVSSWWMKLARRARCQRTAKRAHSERNLWAPYLNSESEAVLFLQVRTAAVSEPESESSDCHREHWLRILPPITEIECSPSADHNHGSLRKDPA